MIKIRKLKSKDIPYMLEWMHDNDTKKIFQTDFSSIGVSDIENFISNSFTENNHHFAIIDDKDDEYLGTISLKNIDYKNRNAEYAISTRKKVQGTGVNKEATFIILKYAFNELNLNKIYLNVLSTNIRAKKFYIKCGFTYEGTQKKQLLIENEYHDLEWYGILNKNNNFID